MAISSKRQHRLGSCSRVTHIVESTRLRWPFFSSINGFISYRLWALVGPVRSGSIIFTLYRYKPLTRMRFGYLLFGQAVMANVLLDQLSRLRESDLIDQQEDDEQLRVSHRHVSALSCLQTPCRPAGLAALEYSTPTNFPTMLHRACFPNVSETARVSRTMPSSIRRSL